MAGGRRGPPAQMQPARSHLDINKTVILLTRSLHPYGNR